MPRLFVDVDDTLILWPGLGSLLDEEDWPKPNFDVIEFVERWDRANPDGKVIVWSLGGADYARKWAYTLLPGHYEDAYDKHPKPHLNGDLYIDDDPPWDFGGPVIHPDILKGLASGT